jgi:hypothetical protein
MASEGREVWTRRVEQWAESGQTAAEFAAEIGVNANTLQHWGWKLASDGGVTERRRESAQIRAARPKREQVEFVEVVGTKGRSVSSGFEVVRTVVRVPPACDAEVLQRLIEALEGR